MLAGRRRERDEQRSACEDLLLQIERTFVPAEQYLLIEAYVLELHKRVRARDESLRNLEEWSSLDNLKRLLIRINTLLEAYRGDPYLDAEGRKSKIAKLVTYQNEVASNVRALAKKLEKLTEKEKPDQSARRASKVEAREIEEVLSEFSRLLTQQKYIDIARDLLCRGDGVPWAPQEVVEIANKLRDARDDYLQLTEALDERENWFVLADCTAVMVVPSPKHKDTKYLSVTFKWIDAAQEWRIQRPRTRVPSELLGSAEVR
jgi:hypothetical protein